MTTGVRSHTGNPITHWPPTPLQNGRAERTCMSDDNLFYVDSNLWLYFAERQVNVPQNG